MWILIRSTSCGSSDDYREGMFSWRNKKTIVWMLSYLELFCGGEWSSKLTWTYLYNLRHSIQTMFFIPTLDTMIKFVIMTIWLSRNLHVRGNSYCPFDISWKDVFCLAFYFKWKLFVLTDHILSETICLSYFSILFSNIYTKSKFTAKCWSDLCNFYSKVIFWNFCLRKYFLLSFAEFKLLMFHNNIVKISEKLNKWN